MFPIGDDNSDRTTWPYVNYAIVGLNVLVFLLLQQLGSNEQFTYAFSLVPKEVTTGIDLIGPQVIRDTLGHTATIMQYATPLPVYFNFLSSMFMHGSIAHIFGNMLFLFIFGDNVEDLIGHVRYAVFYLLCGFAAAMGQILMGPNSIIPMLGASGAISGVLAGYVLLFPRRQVRAIIFNFVTSVPAIVAIGIWIVYQIVLGYLSPAGEGGVAYAAHIGGFAAGLILIKIFALGRGRASV
ncbi:MAG TPA: rhomboid family intramembrane serine protease [Pyrinomonadaceae bacterium]|jgi:membrane associated rhomboid family serine protease|nr:rhomboid family intramembrane serine protease [Pyrinomonadaceae bacterium]